MKRCFKKKLRLRKKSMDNKALFTKKYMRIIYYIITEN